MNCNYPKNNISPTIAARNFSFTNNNRYWLFKKDIFKINIDFKQHSALNVSRNGNRIFIRANLYCDKMLTDNKECVESNNMDEELERFFREIACMKKSSSTVDRQSTSYTDGRLRNTGNDFVDNVDFIRLE